MKTTNILFVLTDSYIFCVGPLIMSIIKNAPSLRVFFNFITPDISEERKEIMTAFIGSLGAESNYFHCDEDDGKGFLSTDRYPRFLYSKMLPHKYLPIDMDRVLGLDADTLVTGDINELYHGDFCDNYVIGCHNRRTLNNLLEKHDDDPNYRDGFNGGVIMYNLDLMRRDITIHTYRQWLQGYLSTGKKLEQFEEWVMANTMRGRYKLMMPFDYNYNLSAKELYDSFCSCKGIAPKQRIVHFLNSNGSTIYGKPWCYYNHFMKGESDTISTTPFYCYYEQWWSYARQLPEKILETYRAYG